MSEPSYEQLLEEYRRQRTRLAEIQRRLAEIACTATAPRQVVAVTAGHGGVVTAVRFPSGAYRNLAPAELGAVVLATITEAREAAVSAAAEVIAPTLPAGVDAHELLSGRADLSSMLPDEPTVPPAVRDLWSNGR